jgi:hypothetical protein
MSRHEDLRENERTIGQLVADASHDIQGIIRSEVALAKAEVSAGAQVMGKGVGLLVGAGVMGLFGLAFLFHTMARAIAVWLPVWAGYLIVTVLLFVVAAVLGLLGKKTLDTARPAPEKAIEQAQLTVAAVKDATGS